MDRRAACAGRGRPALPGPADVHGAGDRVPVRRAVTDGRSRDALRPGHADDGQLLDPLPMRTRRNPASYGPRLPAPGADLGRSSSCLCRAQEPQEGRTVEGLLRAARDRTRSTPTPRLFCGASCSASRPSSPTRVNRRRCPRPVGGLFLAELGLGHAVVPAVPGLSSPGDGPLRLIPIPRAKSPASPSRPAVTP